MMWTLIVLMVLQGHVVGTATRELAPRLCQAVARDMDHRPGPKGSVLIAHCYGPDTSI